MFRSLGHVEFPEFRGVNVNMLPFIMGNPDSLPEEVRQYASLVDACGLPEDELGRVGYLSVSESIVAPGSTQRRPGVHTEGHPMLAWGGGAWGGGWPSEPSPPPPKPKPSKPKTKKLKQPKKKGAGLYMASTVAATCAVWDQLILEPGEMGDCEHLRRELGEGRLLQANELVWLTDRTPHEALFLDHEVQRQWFRLVTSEVGLWYRDHSTENPLVAPAAPIVEGNKFEAQA